MTNANGRRMISVPSALFDLSLFHPDPTNFENNIWMKSPERLDNILPPIVEKKSCAFYAKSWNLRIS